MSKVKKFRNFQPSIDRIEKLIKLERAFIVTVNAEIFLHYFIDEKDTDVLNRFETTLDSKFFWRVRAIFLGEYSTRSITGADLFPVIIRWASESNLKVALFGGSTETKLLLESKLLSDNIDLNYDLIIERVNSNGALPSAYPLQKLSEFDVIIVALGSPKQERFLLKYEKYFKHDFRFGIGVGGALDFYTGEQKRAPLLFRKLSIEWVWRYFTSLSRFRRFLKALRILRYF